MDDSHHSVPSSSIIKRSVIPNDENEKNYQPKEANLQNQKKPMAKNYMSSTISADSKAIAPRKKILAERNEASELSSFDTNVQKISAFEKCHENLSQTETKSPSDSQSHGDEKDAELSSKPYDPLTNYLSPRPRFLRYNPNRRREIFRGVEDGTGEDAEGIINGSSSFDSLIGSSDEAASDSDHGSSISGGGSFPAQEDEVIEGDDEEMEESDEKEIEEEEEEEEKGCNLKGVFKTLLLLAIFVFSTMFMTSINSSTTPLCDLRFHEGIGDGHCKVQNHTFGADIAKNFESGNFLMGGKNIAVNEGVIEEENLEKNEWTDELKEAVNEEVVEEGNLEENEWTDELKEAANVAEIDDLVELVEPQIEENEEVFSEIDGNSEYQGVEFVEKVEFSEDNQTTFSSKERDPGSYNSSSSGIVMNPNEEVHNEEVGDFEKVEVAMPQRILKQMKTEFSFKMLIGVLTFSAIATILLLCFRSRPKKTMKKVFESVLVKKEKVSGKKKDSSSLPSQPLIQERLRSVLATREDQNISLVHSFGKNSHSSSIHSIEKTPEEEEYSESRAPTVELLGEFVVREIRSCSDKENMSKETEEESLSNFSVSSAKIFGGKSHSVSVHAQQARSEFSIGDSPSYGSNTAEKETLKKVETRDGEANVITSSRRRSSRKGEVTTTTPVRRSSRINNLTSP